MPCYYPLNGWQAERGKGITFNASLARLSSSGSRIPMQVPCGQCIGCRLERSRQWAIRCVHEASLYDDNCFITLTYRDQCLPPRGSLVVSDFQKFMKRLRKKVFPRLIRFYQCGEYGELLNRPHYHACIFGYDFPDRVLFSVRDDVRLYTSDILTSLWPFGYSTVGDVTFESAAYVARYILKKITGDKADGYYDGRKPEYTTMSRRPGIADGWFKKYSSDVYPHDYVVIRGGVKCKPPRFYDLKYDIDNSKEMSIIKRERSIAQKDKPDNHQRRLHVRGEVQKERMKAFVKRGFENG